MKHPLSTLTLACIALFGLVACNSYSSPQAVIQTAGHAIKENDIELFRSTLTEDMAAQYANSVEMNKLKETLAPFSEMSVSKGKLIATQQGSVRLCNPAGWHTITTVDTQRTYEVEITGKDASSAAITPLWMAEVSCTIYYSEISHKGGMCYKRDGQFCQISALR